MSRNYLHDYQSGYLEDEGDFNIYDGDEIEESTTFQDEYESNHNLPVGFIDNGLANAIIKDCKVDRLNYIKSELFKRYAVQRSEDINKKITDEEYELFLYNQAKYKHEYIYSMVVKEINDYVKPMISARHHYYNLMGMPMNSRLIELDKEVHYLFI